MKILHFALISIVYLTLSSVWIPLISTPHRYTKNTNDTQYAQILQDTILYQYSDSQYIPITTLPATYFVAVIGDVVDGYVPASYLDIDGFVPAKDIQLVDFEPANKYGMGKLVIHNPDISAVNLRINPDHSHDDNIISQITRTNTDLSYYGTIEGSTFNGDNIWYYIRTIVDDQPIRGFVFGSNMLSTPIPNNIIEAVQPESPNNNINATPRPLTDTTMYIIVGALCIPVGTMMLLMFKKKSKSSSST